MNCCKVHSGFCFIQKNTDFFLAVLTSKDYFIHSFIFYIREIACSVSRDWAL